VNDTIKLLANWGSGEGKIRLTPEWKIESPLMKLDLLQDWIFLLEREYDRERRHSANPRNHRAGNNVRP